MARTKFERKAARNQAHDLVCNERTVGGIRKRDSRGRQRGTGAASMRAKADRNAPLLTHRKRLFADGQQGLAWDAKAGFPLGVYLLRKEISQEQFDAGLRYAASYCFAAKVLGIPAPRPRATVLDPTLQSASAPDWEPTAKDKQRTTDFIEMDKALRAENPLGHQALKLAAVAEAMGKTSERPEGSTSKTLPTYGLETLLEVLETLVKRRLV